MKDFLTSKEYKLTCISPVHIGSGQQLRKYEYIYDREKGQAGFINEVAWQKMLLRRHLLNKFLKTIGDARSLQRFNLLDWLRLQRVPETEIQACIHRYARVDGMNRIDGSTLNDVHLGMATPAGQLYIPGSSIKGALRTGLLHFMLNRDEALKARYRDRLICLLKNSSSKKDLKALDKLTTSLEDKVFAHQHTHKGDDFERKLLSGLVVGDAHLIQPVASVLIQKLDVTTKSRNGSLGENTISLTRECLPAGAQLKLKISLDTQLLGLLKIEEVEDITSCSGVYLTKGLELQEKVFGREYGALFSEAEEADFFLGGGTGFLQKSIWLSLIDDEEIAMDMLKKYLDIRFSTRGMVPMHNHQAIDKMVAPRTLKIARVNGINQLMGLCRLEEM